MISDKAKKLILSHEGLNQPSKWPGGASGITIGIGYDLGYEGGEEFKEDWSPYLTAEEIEKLSTAIGVKEKNAKSIANQFSDIIIKRADAEKVFTEKSLPKYEEQTRDAFPGFDDLPLDAQGALVSLVFNRGPSIVGDRRREMRAIKKMVPEKDLQGIGDQIRSMKRLWEGQGLDGLLRRRDEEADLVESCIPVSNVLNVRPEDIPKNKILDIISNIVRSIFG